MVAQHVKPKHSRHNGAFVCFLCEVLAEQVLISLLCRGTLIAHPMEVEGAVAGFSPFHNVNCSQVFHTLH